MPKKPEKNWKNTKMLIKQNKNSLSASILLLALLNIANIIETLSENPKAGIYIDVVLTSWHCWQKSWKSNKQTYLNTNQLLTIHITYILYQCIIYQKKCRIYNFYLLLKSICIVRCILFDVVKFPVIQLFDLLFSYFPNSYNGGNTRNWTNFHSSRANEHGEKNKSMKKEFDSDPCQSHPDK